MSDFQTLHRQVQGCEAALDALKAQRNALLDGAVDRNMAKLDQKLFTTVRWRAVCTTHAGLVFTSPYIPDCELQHVADVHYEYVYSQNIRLSHHTGCVWTISFLEWVSPEELSKFMGTYQIRLSDLNVVADVKGRLDNVQAAVKKYQTYNSIIDLVTGNDL